MGSERQGPGAPAGDTGAGAPPASAAAVGEEHGADGAIRHDAPLPPLSVLAGGRVRLAASVVSGAVAALAAGLVGPFGGIYGAWPALVAMGGVAGAAFWIDLKHRVIPNRLVLIGLAAMPPLLALADLTTDGASAIRGVLGGAVAFLIYLVLALIAPAGMGMGDVKLAPTLGSMLAFIAWGTLQVGLLAGFVVQGVLSVLLLAAGRAGLKAKIAHGPAMVLGALVAIALA
ncbi:MAG: A24 family peptidase [Acidimicrobiia bacterium]|nr:A24 family peptidase [Acidimicrobiia bacterium]